MITFDETLSLERKWERGHHKEALQWLDERLNLSDVSYLLSCHEESEIAIGCYITTVALNIYLSSNRVEDAIGLIRSLTDLHKYVPAFTDMLANGIIRAIAAAADDAMLTPEHIRILQDCLRREFFTLNVTAEDLASLTLRLTKQES